MVRDTWENLRDTTQKEFFHWFPPGIYGDYHHTNKEFTWREGVCKGVVKFLGLDDPDDAAKLQSRKVDGFALDEPAPALISGGIPEAVFDLALSRSRDPGMKWYPVKLATNNPDETHWTYRRFVDPGTPGFRTFQATHPENEKNLRPGYYAELRTLWAHRPEFVQRFVDGNYGHMQPGKAVTPEWSDAIHLALGLSPVKGTGLELLWDFGLNPTCIVTQVTPTRKWNVLDAFVGDGIGVAELCETWALPLLADKYKGFVWRHIGDPAGEAREQSSSNQSAVRMVVKTLGGGWRSGPKGLAEGVEPLRHVLRQSDLLRVDRTNAKAVWMALRGGWHFHVARTGITRADPVKNIHSHPGDAMRYGAGVLFPLALRRQMTGQKRPPVATYFGGRQPVAPDGRTGVPKRPRGSLGSERPGLLPLPGSGLR
jgi:hypothetical protein